MPQRRTPTLMTPAQRHHRSYLAAVAEFHAEGAYAGINATALATVEGFTAYLRRLGDEALESTPRPAHIVPQTTLWWCDGDEFLGRISIRHRLTDALQLIGGHIGYEVRPSARRQGHATAMLAAALPVANRLGIDSALITCDRANVASRRVIEANGGVLVQEDGDVLRFRVDSAG